MSNISTVTTMTSREIAELTGKEHKNVLRDIRTLADQLHGSELSSGIVTTSYVADNGQSYQQYELDG